MRTASESDDKSFRWLSELFPAQLRVKAYSCERHGKFVLTCEYTGDLYRRRDFLGLREHSARQSARDWRRL